MGIFRKKGSIDYPPEVSAEEHIVHEPIFRPKPEALNIASLVETAKSSDAIDMVPELDEFFDGWVHYAQDRNVFVGSDVIKKLAQARREAIELARQKKYEELESKLEELAGPVASEVETAADAHMELMQERKDSTPKENKEALEGAVGEVEELLLTPEIVSNAVPGNSMNEQFANLKEQAPEERAAMEAAEDAYMERYQEFHRTKGLFAKEPEDLQELKDIYNESRVAYANALETSVAVRLENRDTKGLDKAKLMRRYNALIRYKAVVEPAAQKIYDARLEAMGQREKGIFRKGLERIGMANAALEEKYGKNGARFIRAAATTLAVGVGAGAAGAFGAAGLLGALGWGTYRFGRSLLSSFGGAAAGEAAAQLYGKTRGKRKQKEAVEGLEQFKKDSRHGESYLNTMELEHYDRERVKLAKAADTRTLEQKKMLIRALTAFGVGAGTSAFLSELPSSSGIVEHASVPGAVPGPEPQHIAAPAHEHAPVPHEASVQAVHIDSVSVHGHVNNADRLFGRFVDNARTQFPNPESAPPAIRTLLEQYHHVDGMHEQDVLTHFLHLQNGGSVVVQPGDTLSYENGKVIFQGHTLIDEHGTVQDLREGNVIHIEHPREATVEAHEQVPQPEPPQAIEPRPEPVQPVSVESSLPPEHVEQPASVPEQPAPVPVHVETTPPVEHPVHPEPSNDNTPLPQTETPANVSPGINPNGFDLLRPGVGADSHGNLFAHIERTGDIAKDNELSYNTAMEYASKHHEAVVYYTVGSRSLLGTLKFEVFAVKFNPDHSNWNYFPSLDDPYKMPPIPNDNELRTIAA